jgi:hypothetical protein
MPPTCNIDAKGKMARLIYGILMLIAGGVTAVLWAWPTGGWFPWAVSSFLVTSGLFAIYEARAGWCAVRAMGFKTRF